MRSFLERRVESLAWMRIDLSLGEVGLRTAMLEMGSIVFVAKLNSSFEFHIFPLQRYFFPFHTFDVPFIVFVFHINEVFHEASTKLVLVFLRLLDLRTKWRFCLNVPKRLNIWYNLIFFVYNLLKQVFLFDVLLQYWFHFSIFKCIEFCYILKFFTFWCDFNF